MNPVTVYDSLDELYLEAAEQLLEDGTEQGSRDGQTKEICGYAFRLANPFAHFIFNPERKLSASYAAAEFIWYVAGKTDPELILAYAPQYKRFLDVDGTGKVYAHGQYGARWSSTQGNGFTQIANVIRILSKKPDSRQAILTCWDRDTDLEHCEREDRKDIPCTLSMQFLIREGKLNCVCTMRSNDIWLGLPYDVFAFTCLQIIIASALKVGVGWYQHHAGSLHVYSRNYTDLDRVASSRSFSTGPLGYMQDVGYVSEKIRDLVKLEQYNRRTKCCSSGFEGTLGGPGTIFSQLLIMAASKWWDTTKHCTNPLMKKHLERAKE